MMRLYDQFLDKPVLSIHAGHAIAQTTSILLNPHNLTVAGFFCQPIRTKKELLLVTSSIREVSPDGFVVNHQEDLAEKDELLRHKEIIDLNYKLVGKPVFTESKKRLGKVVSYVIDDNVWAVSKLHVQKPVWRGMFDNALIIDRSMVVSVSPQRVIVKDAFVKEGAEESAPAAVPTTAV